MSNLILINNLNCSLLKNAEHIQYHTNVMTIIEGLDAESIGLESVVYDAYCQAIEVEQDIVNKAYGSIYTQEMQTADGERCNVYRRIYRKLITCEVENADSAKYKAWPVIERNLVLPYGLSVVQLPLQEKTAVLSGFVMDAREKLSSQQIEKVGIDGDLDDLAMANQKFERMYQERINEKSEAVMGYNSLCRAATDAAWKHVYTLLNALANSTDTAKAAQTATAIQAVNKINVLTEETRQRLTFRLKANKAFIDKLVINDDESLVLPLPMDEVVALSVVGNKLTGDNVKIVVLEKSTTGTSKHKTYTVAEFTERFDGQFEIDKDEATGIDTMTITGFATPTAITSATIESVEMNA